MYNIYSKFFVTGTDVVVIISDIHFFSIRKECVHSYKMFFLKNFCQYVFLEYIIVGLTLFNLFIFQLTDDVARKKTEYQKYLELYKLMRSRFEEHYVKCK